MKIKGFELERYFAKHEFKSKYLLSSSDCDGYSLKYILDCADREELRLWNDLKFGYTDSAGSLFLRESIAVQYKNISPDNIIVLSPGEANFILMNIFLEAGDEIVCMYPAYQSLYQIAADMGCKVKFWKPDEKMKYNIEVLEDLVNEKTKLLIVNFPHNPTGFIPTQPELMKIIDISNKYNVLLFSDEIYHQLVHNERDVISSISDMCSNSVSLGGMSKSFGLAGLRIGWLVTKRPDLIRKILTFKDYLTICNNAAGEVLSYIALNHKEKFITPNIKKIIRNKDIFKKFVMNNNEFLNFSDTKAGSVALVRLKTDITSLEYCENIVRETGIMLVPSEMFNFGNTHIRIGFGREDFEEALNVWQKYIYLH